MWYLLYIKEYYSWHCKHFTGAESHDLRVTDISFTSISFPVPSNYVYFISSLDL